MIFVLWTADLSIQFQENVIVLLRRQKTLEDVFGYEPCRMKVTSLSLSHTHKCYIIHGNSYTNRQKENRIQTHKHKTHSTTITKQTTKHTYASSSITKLQNTHTKRHTQPSGKKQNTKHSNTAKLEHTVTHKSQHKTFYIPITQTQT